VKYNVVYLCVHVTRAHDVIDKCYKLNTKHMFSGVNNCVVVVRKVRCSYCSDSNITSSVFWGPNGHLAMPPSCSIPKFITQNI